MKICNTCKEGKPLDAYEKGSTYKGGFRPQCKACRKLKQKQRAAKGLSEDSHFHGTYTGYTSYNCKCTKCKKAAADRQRQKRARNKASLEDRKANTVIPPEFHGTVKGYRHYFCRCEPCKTAEKEYKAKRWANMTPEQKKEHALRYISHSITGRRKRRNKEKAAKLPIDDRHIANAYLRCSINDVCFYCGEVKEEMHWDHFYPVSKNGTDHWWNMKRACKDCNLSKYNRCGTWWILKRGNVNV
jgi:hypothetical protein